MSMFKIKPNNSQIELSLNTLYFLYNMRSLSELPEGFYSQIITDFFETLNLGKMSSKSTIPSTVENIQKLISCLDDTKYDIYEKILVSQNLPCTYDKTKVKIKMSNITSRNGLIHDVRFYISYPCLVPFESYHHKAESFIREIIDNIKIIQDGINKNNILCYDFDYYHIESIDLPYNSMLISKDFHFDVVDLFEATKKIQEVFGTEDSKDYFYNLHIINSERKSITLKIKKHIKLED